MIYLDNNATTAVDPEVYDAVFASLKRDTGNPSSVHLPGRKVKEVIERNRAKVADFLGCSPSEIYFTSGGTEANNLAIIGAAKAALRKHVVLSAIEHPSVSNACTSLKSGGFEITVVPAGIDGVVDLEKLKEALRSDTCLITVMHSNNETGAIQPVEEIGRLAKERGILFHTDAAQSVGKTKFLVSQGIDMATIVSHKFYGPKGIGALFIRSGTSISPVMFGAGHEKGLRPGTENVAGIVGIGKACEIAKRDLKLRISHTLALREKLAAELRSHIPDIHINAEKAERLPNTLSVVIPGVGANALVEALKDEVAFSAGSACHAGLCSPSAVLKQMGLSDADALSTIRLSLGKDNTVDDVVDAALLIGAAAKRLKVTSL